MSNRKRDLDSHLNSRSVCIFLPRLVYIPELSLLPRQVPDFNEQTRVSNGHPRCNSRIEILISDKIDFKIKAVKRDKEAHYIMIKGSIQEEDITIINIYVPNIGALQYVRQMLKTMKEEINNNTIIVGDFNTPLTPMNRSTKQEINKET